MDDGRKINHHWLKRKSVDGQLEMKIVPLIQWGQGWPEVNWSSYFRQQIDCWRGESLSSYLTPLFLLLLPVLEWKRGRGNVMVRRVLCSGTGEWQDQRSVVVVVAIIWQCCLKHQEIIDLSHRTKVSLLLWAMYWKENWMNVTAECRENGSLFEHVPGAVVKWLHPTV